jgi:resuscitation-promoting factor RpfB
MNKTITTTMLTVALLAGGGANAAAIPAPDAGAGAIRVATAATTQNTKLKAITLKVGKAKKRITHTRAKTVGQLLAWREIRVGTHDRVSPALEAPLANKMKIVIKRIKRTTVSVTEKVKVVIKKKNSKLRRGTTKVLVAGAVGKAHRTYVITKVNGKLKTKVKVAETILVPAVTRVIAVGTKGKALNLKRMKLWNRIARCESGGRWHINTGNGYYGGLQFSLATWRANGGRDFASKPHKATKGEQITVANRLYAKRGTRPWGCA